MVDAGYFLRAISGTKRTDGTWNLSPDWVTVAQKEREVEEARLELFAARRPERVAASYRRWKQF